MPPPSRSPVQNWGNALLYFPEWLLEPRRRGERALTQVVTECYVRDVSTRRVDGLVRTLGLEGMSKSQVSQLAKELNPVVEIFASQQAVVRLIGAVLAEYNDEWMVTRCYTLVSALEKAQATVGDSNTTEFETE